MTCDQRRDLMPLLLMDSLEPAEALELRAHLAGGCPRCAGALAEAETALSYLPFALRETVPGAVVRDRLMARISRGEPRRGTGRVSRWIRAAMPAALAACLTFVATAWFMMRVNRAQRVQYDEVVSTRERTIQSLVRQVRDTNGTLEPLLHSRRQAVLASPTQPRAFARVWWDEGRRAWHFRAFGLEQPESAKIAYELWFITPYGRKVPAVTFKPDSQGGAYVVVTVPAEVGPIAAFAVTDEPSVGTFAPTGVAHLYGKVE
jgi:hypothetical protein